MKTKLQNSLPGAVDKHLYSYPAHRVLGIFNLPEDVRKTLNDLKESGFSDKDVEVICNRGEIDLGEDQHGIFGRIVHALHHLSSEGKYLDRYEEELAKGHLLVSVSAKDTDTKEVIKDILQSRGGYRLTYFGNWVIEGIPESDRADPGDFTYGFRRNVELPFNETLEKTRIALKKEGFGVLTEIDMREKLKEKLGVEFRNYVILGACNPPLAYEALRQDLEIGLLLPCNVVVYESNGGCVAAVIDAAKMLSVADNSELETTANTVNEKLRRAIESI